MSKSKLWWAVYRQIVKDALRGDPTDDKCFYPTAGAAATAAFKALWLDPNAPKDAPK